jgi:hypothetical protein
MLANPEVRTVRQHLSHVTHTRLRFLGALIFLGLFTSLPCYGQMGSYAIYSDTWIDDSGVDSSKMYDQGVPIPGARAVSWGVTQDNANYYNHRYWVQTKITGPDGRTSTATSYTSSSYARAEATLPLTLSESELGTFQTNSTHSMSCPYMNGIILNSSTFDVVGYGFSQACYYRGATGFGMDTYYIVGNCANKITCSQSSFIWPTAANYTYSTLRWGFFIYYGSPYSQRFCTGKYTVLKAPNGCTSTACRDFPPLQPLVAKSLPLLQYARK